MLVQNLLHIDDFTKKKWNYGDYVKLKKKIK
jgi:hypothetical protein